MTFHSSFESANQPALPNGYCFFNPYSVGLREVTALDEAVNGINGSWMSELDWPDTDHEKRTYVGVRSLIDKTLVGLALLEKCEQQKSEDLTLRVGALGYMMVHPNHRHKGLGKALIMERIRLAKLSDLEKLTILLTTTNSLRPFYQELGFRALDEDSDDFELTLK